MMSMMSLNRHDVNQAHHKGVNDRIYYREI